MIKKTRSLHYRNLLKWFFVTHFGSNTNDWATSSLFLQLKKYLKPLFAQGNFSDMTVLSVFTSYIWIALWEEWNLHFPISESPNFRNFFCSFYIHTIERNIFLIIMSLNFSIRRPFYFIIEKTGYHIYINTFLAHCFLLFFNKLLA